MTNQIDIFFEKSEDQKIKEPLKDDKIQDAIYIVKTKGVLYWVAYYKPNKELRVKVKSLI